MTSQTRNDGTNKPGSIYRIRLKDFVTYKTMEIFPGPSLNIIIGPNGSGKSTFVCAIILGLCGKTDAIGRANKIGEFVRAGCEEAKIEIELYRKRGKNNVIITRIFNLNNVSKWKLDNATVKEKDVQELITRLNIQVDNLCQLLPQDKMQDFTRMNPQQLLRSTLAALGEQDSVDKLDEMIHWRSEHKKLASRLQNSAQSLEEQKRLNERLKTVIEAMQQRKQIEREINMCEKKKMWIEYQDLRKKYQEYKTDIQEAAKIVEKHRQNKAPLEAFINEAQSSIRNSERRVITNSEEVNAHKEKIKHTLESIQQQQFKMQTVENRFNDLLERHQNKKQEIRQEKALLDKYTVDKERLKEKVGEEAFVRKAIEELELGIKKTNATIQLYSNTKVKLVCELEEVNAPKRMYQQRINELQNMDIKRLNYLKNNYSECYQAVQWFRKNKDSFEHPVYEPMMLEINFTDPNFARYLEARVARRDLLAFTFENTNDMNKFMSTMRSLHLKRNVNAVCSPPSNQRYESQDLQRIRHLGFFANISDTISAPEAITRYLCKMYNIHKIPIGNAHTYDNSGKVPNDIRFFFTENHRFSVKVSAYSGQTSCSTVEIAPAQLLANTVDVEHMDEYNKLILKCEKTEKSIKDKIRDTDQNIRKLQDASLNELIQQRNEIRKGVDQVRTIDTKIKMQRKKIQQLESEPTLNMEKETQVRDEARRECVRKQCKLHRELVEAAKKLHRIIIAGMAIKVQLRLSRDAIVQQEAQLRELRQELNSAEATYQNILALLKRTNVVAKQKLNEALKSCNNIYPNDLDYFPYLLEFAKIPHTMTEMLEYMAELQARVSVMDQNDENVIKEYRQRERTIAKLTEEINNSGETTASLDDRIKTRLAEWLPIVESLLSKINKKFGEMFEKFSCAGEIKLDKSEGDELVEKLGLSILVKFRSEERLQQLTRQQQSGGERAVSTAIYLMALQALTTTVPFRCVDEINQGMDALNERKMMKLLIQVTTRTDNTQYFFLTPKLLKDLQYNEKIMVHTIMNGKTIMNYTKWDINRFIQSVQ